MSTGVTIEPGPWLLRAGGPGLDAHRATHGALGQVGIADLVAVLDSAPVRGRGGAGFPFGTKLRAVAAARGRPFVVVNLAEGEPASHKDAALAVAHPHLVLDGAEACARALGVRRVHLVLPEERSHVLVAVEHALRERADASGWHRRLRWQVHLAAPGFVSGEASAVTELVAGRPGLPVTSWQPTALSGVNGKPTLLSNAETYAHVAALLLGGVEEHARLGTQEEPGTTLLTIGGLGESRPRVREVEHGTPWAHVLGAVTCERPVLLGGYHGTWAAAGVLRGEAVSRPRLRELGLALGAGVVLPLPAGACPLRETAAVVRYLASSSARRCGPCFNGLPALADTVDRLVAGRPSPGLDRLLDLVDGRGACAHPDGTVRLVRSALAAFPEEVQAHLAGGCVASRPVWASR